MFTQKSLTTECLNKWNLYTGMNLGGIYLKGVTDNMHAHCKLKWFVIILAF